VFRLYGWCGVFGFACWLIENSACSHMQNLPGGMSRAVAVVVARQGRAGRLSRDQGAVLTLDGFRPRRHPQPAAACVVARLHGHQHIRRAYVWCVE
jgi:hypothetical protein